MARSRRSLTSAEREARRKRVERRRAWAKSTQTDEVLSITAHGRTIHLHDAEEKIPKYWRTGKPYEHRLLGHIYQQKFSGVAVDAGANIGNHTIWFAAVCGLDVVAFEPVKHADLAANVALNDLGDRVRLERVALGATEDTALHVGKGRLNAGRGNLPVRTLDSYKLKNVSVIKADVEGMEPQVLQGGEETIRRDRPVIFAEEWGETEHAAIAAVLEPWGYRLTRRLHGKDSPTPVGRWDPT